MTKRQAVRDAALAGSAVVALAARAGRRRPRLGVALAAGGALAAWGAFGASSPVFGRPVRSGPRRRARAALTFDDGPGPSTAAVLDALAGEGVRATFFVLGRQVERRPHEVRRMVAEGHEIASHGYDHGILVFRGPRHVADQLRRTEQAVARAAGRGVLSRYFRAPHGFRGPATLVAARRAGYRTVSWTRGVFDSADPGAEVIAARAARALAPGAVILLHDADGWHPERERAQTAEAIPAICAAARERGIELVALTELLAG
jgi:peptidoglycan/xylan/chitin deacetylase (PgdA/CDA1 family)